MGYGSRNGTVTYGLHSGTFTNAKREMPHDQKAKLLAMHRAGRANAGIYVAVVLAVYVVLLTILLCRYTRRQRPSESSSSGGTNQTGSSGPFSFVSNKFGCGNTEICRSVCSRLFYCCSTPPRQVDDPTTEIADYPLSTIQTKVDTIPDKPTCV